MWQAVQKQLGLRAQSQPQTQRRAANLLSGLGQCGLCGSGWIRVNTGYWGCAGHRNGVGYTNNRVIGDAFYEKRVLRGLTERLLDPEAVELFVNEFHAEHSRRSRIDANEKPTLQRRIARLDGQLDRLVDAIADGIGEKNRVKQRFHEAHLEKRALEERLADLDAERVVAFHPKIAVDYRQEVEALQTLLADRDNLEVRDDVIPRIRAVVEAISLTPAAQGRGVDIEVTGRLARIIELATGRKPELPVLITLERVKGI